MKGSFYQKVTDLTARKGGIEMIGKLFKSFWLDEKGSSDFYAHHLKTYFPEEISLVFNDWLDGGNR